MLMLSPLLLDHSFPRTVQDLANVSIALGEIEQLLKGGDVLLVSVDVFSLFVEDFYWEKIELHAQLIDIVNVLSEWLLRSPATVKTVCLDSIGISDPHPLPNGVSSLGCAGIWAEQAGKLLQAHNASCDGSTPFIGIACDRAFSGSRVGALDNPTGAPSLPLVGPSTL